MNGWSNCKIGDLFDVQAGGDLQKDKYSELQTACFQYPIFSNSLVNKGLYGYTSEARYPSNCVTITARGTLGHAEYRAIAFDAIVRLLVLIPKVKVDCRFVTHYINHLINFPIESTGVPQLPAPRIKKKNIFIPSDVNEQKAIADILNKVDDVIESVERSIVVVGNLKNSLMQNMLTGKLKPDGTWRRDEEFYIDDKFGKIPVGWHIIKGNKITDKITKGQSPKWQGFEYQSSGILFVTSENVRDGFIDVSNPKFLPVEFNEKIKNSQLQKGDILINIVGASVGRCAIYNLNEMYANINQAVCILRVNEKNDNKYISYYLQSQKTQRRLLRSQVETARANLSLGDFRKFKFVIPIDKEEQILISNELDKVEELINSKIEKLAALKKLKKSLMQNLLTGKIRVNVDKINELLKGE